MKIRYAFFHDRGMGPGENSLLIGKKDSHNYWHGLGFSIEKEYYWNWSDNTPKFVPSKADQIKLQEFSVEISETTFYDFINLLPYSEYYLGRIKQWLDK